MHLSPSSSEGKPASPTSSEHQQPNPDHKARRSRRRCLLWILLAGVLPAILILIFCLAFLLPRRQSQSQSSGDSDSGEFYTLPASAYPSPIDITGTVPHNKKAQTLDPSLVRRAGDGRYFLFTTGGANGSLWTADAVSGPWNKTAGPGSGAGPLLAEDVGAPQVYGPLGGNGTYYLYHNSHSYNYTASDGVTNAEASKNSHDASLVVHTSQTLEPGSWKRQGRLGIPWAEKYNVLDAALLTVSPNNTANATNIFAFGSYQSGIYAVPLADPPTRLLDSDGDGNSKADYEAATAQMVHLEANASATHPQGQTEATFLYARGAWTYLFFSSGRCCPGKGGSWPAQSAGDVYRVMVCRRSSPSSEVAADENKDSNTVLSSWAENGGDGDFVDKEGKSCRAADGGTEILASHGGIWAPGGQGVLDDDSDEAGDEGVLLYYHYVPFDEQAGKPEKGFRFGFNRLRFGDDGWPVVV
ncbi:hypothetical protein SLS62_005431 [Diatrype stigma]|uniref:Arabinanase/levansucrase/invertase n=1 Tax=Diatrype stigma TaxID=117547 RepID=A0AAN9USS3_9PEZI